MSKYSLILASFVFALALPALAAAPATGTAVVTPSFGSSLVQLHDGAASALFDQLTADGRQFWTCPDFPELGEWVSTGKMLCVAKPGVDGATDYTCSFWITSDGEVLGALSPACPQPMAGTRS